MLSGQEVSKKPLASRNAASCLPLKLPLRVRAALSCRDQQCRSFGAFAGSESVPLTRRSGGGFWRVSPPAAISAYRWFDAGVLRTQRPELLDFEARHCASVSKAHFCPPPATRHQS